MEVLYVLIIILICGVYIASRNTLTEEELMNDPILLRAFRKEMERIEREEPENYKIIQNKLKEREEENGTIV